jgi:hypothetical protein
MRLNAVSAWALLVAATVCSGVLTENTHAVRAGATAVILIATFKINLVVAHFMELRWQPRPFRMVVSAWLVLITSIILGAYWAP